MNDRSRPTPSGLKAWLLQGLGDSRAAHAQPKTAPWWRVMCLTGVDYFSTLGYQPSIAFLAASFIAPFATLVLVALTLFGALPVYRRMAALSPRGQGSLSVLEERLPRWRGKALVLVLLGFAATSFIITITLSAADATAHIVENPFAPAWLHHEVILTCVLIAALGAIFLRGFSEAIWLAVGLVAVFIGVNVTIIGYELFQLATHPETLSNWRTNLFAQEPSFLRIAGLAVLYSPALALGLSGFETGVAVMPLVGGDGNDEAARLKSRIANSKKLLTGAALIMSVLLIGSSIVVTMQIPPEALRGGEADGRALAYLAHRDLGGWFGTLYDLSTISTLWFAGSSAMAGLLNLVPQYLPRYGMAPDWARATRPLVLVFTAVCFFVTAWFDANVNAQAGAYATGVLVLITSAAVAVFIALPAERVRFGIISAVFVYTTIVTVVDHPDGLRIAGWFVVGIVASSFVSRVLRSTEVRIESVEYDETALTFIREAAGRRQLRIIANRPNAGDVAEYVGKIQEAKHTHNLKTGDFILFLEVRPSDVSSFAHVLRVTGVDVGGHHVLRCSSPAIPNAIAGLLLDLRDKTFSIPHAYFGWTEGNPIVYLLRFLALGEGDTAPVCREVLRQAEPIPERRPRIHVG
jgi:hypothetical protein